MKRTALALLGLACLTAMPSIAQARYRDGMNLYQYVQSRPTVGVDPSGMVMQVEDIGPPSAFDHWRDGTGETIEVIGQGFINHVKSIHAVKSHIENLETSMRFSMKRDAKTVDCDGVVTATDAKNQAFTMTGWRWAAFGTAYHDYTGKCVGKKKCLDKPLGGPKGPCKVVEYDCIYNVSGHDRYHNFVKVQRSGGGDVGECLYGLLWLWGKAGSSTWNAPKPFDILWSYQDSTSGKFGVDKPIPHSATTSAATSAAEG